MTYGWAWGLVGLMMLVWVPDAEAQRRDRHQIDVSPRGASCTYQIMDQADQDLFVMAPGGRLTVRALDDLLVEVRVEDDQTDVGRGQARGRIPGTANRRAITLTATAPVQSLKARGRMGRSTEHDVRIECCPDVRDDGTCPRWREAMPVRTSGDAGSSGAFAPMPWETTTSRGPSAPAAAQDPSVRPTDPPGPGGPKMRVEEGG